MISRIVTALAAYSLSLGASALDAPRDTDWLSYNKRLDGNRFAELNQINSSTAMRLEEACRVRVDVPGPFTTGIILAEGALFVTTSRATVAINPTNCDVLWKSLYVPEEKEVIPPNRGVAYFQGMIFRGTPDGRLVAYDAQSGVESWRQKIGDPGVGENVSAAPIAWDGKVFVGPAGSEFGTAGRMMAFDAKTGRKIWSFNTVPHPGEYGSDTWPGDTWKHGGGGTWTSYSLDETTGELFVPVGNPGPDLNPAIRRGDNLFTGSVLVLDARTGVRLWHFQGRKNDNHDYDMSAPAVLFERDHRRFLAQGSKDGYVYLIDRSTHALVWKTAVTTISNSVADAAVRGTRICPGLTGGIQFNSPAYDPDLNQLTVGSVDWCYMIYKEKAPLYTAGETYMGGTFRRDGIGFGWVTALDAATGAVRWRYKTDAPVVAAVTSTGGGVTFAGDTGGVLYVFRTADGKVLWQTDTGGGIAGGMITYQIENRQYLATTSGNVSRSSWVRASGSPSIVVYRLNAESPATAESAAVEAAAAPPDAERGGAIFANTCAACHGGHGEGLEGPRLRGVVNTKFTFEQTVAYIRNPSGAMPKFYPGSLSAQDVADVAAYVRGLQ